MVGLVDGLVKHGMMQDTMDPVYEIVGEEQEAGGDVVSVRNGRWNIYIQRDREEKVEPSVLGHVVVQPGIAHDLGLEPGERQQRHDRKRFQTGLNFGFDLVFVEPRVLHHFMIEYELVRKTSEAEVEDVDANQCDYGQRHQLSGDVVSWPCGLRQRRYR